MSNEPGLEELLRHEIEETKEAIERANLDRKKHSLEGQLKAYKRVLNSVEERDVVEVPVHDDIGEALLRDELEVAINSQAERWEVMSEEVMEKDGHEHKVAAALRETGEVVQ